MTTPNRNKTLEDLEKYAERWGFCPKSGNGFWDWVTLRLVGAKRMELELSADKAANCEFTRWWYGSRMQTMDAWMRKNAPEDVKHAYFSIVANGSAEFSVPQELLIKGFDGEVYKSLLEAADNALAETNQLRTRVAELEEDKKISDTLHTQAGDVLDEVRAARDQYAEDNKRLAGYINNIGTLLGSTCGDDTPEKLIAELKSAALSEDARQRIIDALKGAQVLATCYIEDQADSETNDAEERKAIVERFKENNDNYLQLGDAIQLLTK